MRIVTIPKQLTCSSVDLWMKLKTFICPKRLSGKWQLLVQVGSIGFKLLHDLAPEGVRIAEQHPSISMTAYQSDFGDAEALFKKAADRFVTKIVKVEILRSSLSPYGVPCRS
jgi:hypothetical protein